MHLVSKHEAAFLAVVALVVIPFLAFTIWLAGDPGYTPTIEATAPDTQTGGALAPARDESKNPTPIDGEELPERLAPGDRDALDAQGSAIPVVDGVPAEIHDAPLADIHGTPTEVNFGAPGTGVNVQAVGGEGRPIFFSLGAGNISAARDLKLFDADGNEISLQDIHSDEQLFIEGSDGKRRELRMMRLDGDSGRSVITIHDTAPVDP